MKTPREQVRRLGLRQAVRRVPLVYDEHELRAGRRDDVPERVLCNNPKRAVLSRLWRADGALCELGGLRERRASRVG